ncbi:MAG: type II secretion system F family protein, partial [Gemmatimonadetes bacterium]|nr:type II secretion system F family protein [Gemmatimonadota bacterium]
GETSGSLPAALRNGSQFYERDVRDALVGLLKMLEPAMTVILGGMLGLIMFSVLSPIYDVFGKFKF